MPIDFNRERVNPFPYQARAGGRIWGVYESGGDRCVVVHATGTGKTVVGGLFARDVLEFHGGRVLWLAHRDLLCRQAIQDLAFCGVEAVIEKADEYARSNILFDSAPDCVVGSVQTLQRKRLQSWPRDYFDAIIVDEAHHAVGGTYTKILEYFKFKWLLGLTATPDRLDGEDIGAVFGTVADEYHLPDAIEDGFLKRVKIIRVASNVDLAELSTRGKSDYNDADLERLMMPHIRDLANLTAQYLEHRRAFVFTPGVKSAEIYADALTKLGIPSAAVSGEAPNIEEVWTDFREGRIRCVCNCEIATEGANFPFVSAVVLARPTKSRAKLSQMVGRGTRKHAGQENCLVIDFAYLTGTMKLAKVTDLLVGPKVATLDDDTRGIIDSLVDEGDERDLLHVVKQAERVKIRRDKLKAQEIEKKRIEHHARIYDAFGMEDPEHADAPRAAVPVTLRPKVTEKQLEALAKFGVKIDANFDRGAASAILDRCVQRAKSGLSSKKQIDLMVRLGVPLADARAMKFEEASHTIDGLLKGRR